MDREGRVHPSALGRWGRASCALAAILVVLGGAGSVRADCAVTYTIYSQWNPGFNVGITVKNVGSTPVNGWTLGWTFAEGQVVTQLWNGAVSQTGAQVTVTDAGYNRDIPAGGSVTLGFNGTWSDANSAPSAFTLNGAVCGDRPTTYSLAISVTGAGSTNPAAGIHAIAAGTTVAVTAVPAPGAVFAGWSGAVVGTENPLSIVMDADKVLTASFSGGPVVCRGNYTCSAGQYCQLPEGQCRVAGATGTCATQPEVCLQYMAPVCGCDGHTYYNGCAAAGAGVSIDYAGECKPVVGQCGGIVGTPCAAGQFCQLPTGQCRTADATGVCRATGGFCTTEWNPVCGCDGRTFSNACFASVAGVSVLYTGSCVGTLP